MPFCENLGFVCSTLGVIGLVAVILITSLCTAKQTCGDPDPDSIAVLEKLRKKLLTITVAMLIAGSVIPTEKTITKMIVAQNVTYERVEVAADTVQTVYEDIMGLFEDGE
jgi:hypothetical protein